MDMRRPGAVTSLLVVEDPLTSEMKDRIVDVATRLRLPTMAGPRDYAVAGALLAYGANRAERYHRAAEYVDKILKGTRPGDLPVEQPTKFQLIINLKTANALGVTIPP